MLLGQQKRKADMVERQSAVRSPQSAVKKEKIINLPLTKKDVMGLNAGDVVLINGMIVTGRDKMHKFIFYEKLSKKDIPFNLSGAVLYHCGPIVKKSDSGYKVIASGPTTSIRVETYEHR